MRYSLVSRFRGALLGALLGKSLTSDGDVDKIAVLGMESLIRLGRLDVDEWREHQQQNSLHSEPTLPVSPNLILNTLPVALFFHENTIRLRQSLLRVLQIWEDDPVARDGTLAVGYAIAKSLTEKLQPQTLIPETIAFIGETPTLLPQQLIKVNELLNQGAGLDRVQTELSKDQKQSHAVAMAFYCFLDTLEDYRLGVLRATHTGDLERQNPEDLYSYSTSAIVGALSGAYNSTAGIPANWRVFHSQPNLTAQGMTNFSQMLKLVDVLAAVWSGMCNFDLHSSKLKLEEGVMSDGQEGVSCLSVYAAPRVIRSR
ncbi:ADP-ribosylglycohydrolase family protein [Fortiea contorta]|uniref:ADP-ribosylglycohydrolase family protein n=1 Tax=Fortiea contorta TaxID=1892405 RepID=UPI0003476D62|nr:ADP-ribosylglycohydrolase family protein [Fortiea contorta]